MVEELTHPAALWPAMATVAVGSGWFAVGKNTEFLRVTLLPPPPSVAPSNWISPSSGHRSPYNPLMLLNPQFASEYTTMLGEVVVLNPEVLGSIGVQVVEVPVPGAHNQLSPPISMAGPVPAAQTPPAV